jgi:hypothetical protein
MQNIVSTYLEYAISYSAQVMQDWQRFCVAYERGELKI